MKNKVNNFIDILNEYGEIYFTSGSYKQDYRQIIGVIKAQGYYSGIYYRFYFNDRLELVKVEYK